MNTEILLLTGLIKIPALLFSCSDLESFHFTNKEIYKVYKLLYEIDYEVLRNESFVSVYTESRGKINNELRKSILEWSTGFLDTELNSENILRCYRTIRREYLEQVYQSKMKKIHSENNSFIEKLEQVEALTAELKNDIDDGLKTQALSTVEEEEEKRVLDTGLKEVDKVVCLQANYLIMLAARPFSGKTTFACKLAMENSKRGKVVFISMEMSTRQINNKVKEYGPAYNRENILMLDKSTITLTQITKLILKHSPICVIIDQLNKIKYPAKNEYERFTMICKNLKEIAVQYQTPIICLAQVSRSGEGLQPRYKDLKGSGSIEEEADVVFFLHVTDRSSGYMELIVGKNRSLQGSIGEHNLRFYKETNFYDER